MEFLTELLPEQLLMALGWTLVHSFWQLILVAGCLWMSLRIFRESSPAMKYGFSVGALLISFLVVLGTFVYEYVQFQESAKGPNGEILVYMSNLTFVQAEANMESILDHGKKWVESSLPVLVNIWFLGALLFLFRLLNSLSEIRTLRKSSSPVNDFELEKTLYRLIGKLGISQDVSFKISKGATSPLTFGILKPVILLPAGLIFQLTSSQLEAILAHELAHVKRNDYLSNLLLSSLEVFFFFHPCYWWMSDTLHELRENAADDLVVKAGIEPKSLATGLAEVLNFAKQNPPELALAAGKKRNPTLQRIKRILGYPAQNYPQTPIISIPMLFTLFLSAGLIASAQQDTPKAVEPIVDQIKSGEIHPTFVNINAQDTTVKKHIDPKTKEHFLVRGKDVMIISTGEGYTYRIKGDTLISNTDTLVLRGKTKEALDKIRILHSQDLPVLDIPKAPEFPANFAKAPVPHFEMHMNMPEMPSMPRMDLDRLNFPAMSNMHFEFDHDFPAFNSRSDTTKMTKEEREKWLKEQTDRSKEWSKQAQEKAKEWEANWKENEADFQNRMKEWEARFKDEFGPKMKEFEVQMKEWKVANEPKMKEFEAKMKTWQESQEPMIKEFEAQVKEWEKAQKPKLEEFEKKMELWKKENEAKMQEFQKLIQEELQKRKD
jgi:bla regulator protein blaR1